MIKVCNKCSMDLNGQKRIKDASGSYFCHDCWASRQPQTASALTNASRPAPPPIPTQTTALPKVCSNCGLEMGALQQHWDWQGHHVCLTCHDLLEIEQKRREEANAQEARQKSAQSVEQAGNALISTDKRRKALSGLIYLFIFLPFVILAECGFLLDAAEKKDSDAYIGVAFFGCLIPFGFIAIFVQLKRYRAATAGSAASVLRDDLVALSGTMLKWLAVIAAVISGIAAIIWAASWLMGGWGVLIGLFVVVVVLFGMASAVDQSKCPRCQRWFVAVTDRSDHVGQSQHLVTKMKAVNITSKYAQGDRVVGQVDVPVQETMVTDAFQLHRHCKRCGHHWTATAKRVTKA